MGVSSLSPGRSLRGELTSPGPALFSPGGRGEEQAGRGGEWSLRMRGRELTGREAVAGRAPAI